MRQSPAQDSFNGGEYTPRMKGRRDTEDYQKSCQEMRNWVPRAQGSMRKRPGSTQVQALDPAPTPPSSP